MASWRAAGSTPPTSIKQESTNATNGRLFWTASLTTMLRRLLVDVVAVGRRLSAAVVPQVDRLRTCAQSRGVLRDHHDRNRDQAGRHFDWRRRGFCCGTVVNRCMATTDSPRRTGSSWRGSVAGEPDVVSDGSHVQRFSVSGDAADRLTQQVGVPAVPRVILDHVGRSTGCLRS